MILALVISACDGSDGARMEIFGDLSSFAGDEDADAKRRWTRLRKRVADVRMNKAYESCTQKASLR